MQKLYNPARIVFLFVAMAAMLTLFIFTLYRMQIHDAWFFTEEDLMPPVSTRVVTLPAARGSIYDRNGVLLISGSPSLNITLHHTALQRSGNINDILQELIIATMDEGIDYTDTFPITRGAPFSFVTNMSNEQRRRLETYIDFFGLDPNISAPDLLAWMRGHYRIDYTVGISAARLIIGVRYELEIRRIIGTITPYVFAHNIDPRFASILEERNLIGVNIESSFVRQHHTPYAAHLLGYTGPIPQGRVEEFLEQGYAMDAIVGITGVEAAFEHELRGIPGRKTIRTTADGAVVDVVINEDPIPGNHVFLSIDIHTQTAAEHALRAQIHSINAEREEEFMHAEMHGDLEEDFELELIPGGAVVVTDVNTGEVLAAASYPTFNPATLSQDIGTLIHDERLPLFNRAVNGRFIPGSTFKMVTGFAGLRYGAIDRYTQINCTGVFDRYYDIDGTTTNCWIFTAHRVGHGLSDIVTSLEYSCNVFYLHIGAVFRPNVIEGANTLGAIAAEFGLGVPTGIELNESVGILATPHRRWELSGLPEGITFYIDEDDVVTDARWFVNETSQIAFGQGENRFTPLQLANYAATIANGGTLYDLTILRTIRSYDFITLHEQTPNVRHVIPESAHLEIIREGMLQASISRRGTAYSVFGHYPILAPSKTGTAQAEGQDTNDGAFVVFAPAENPEIAIAVLVEKGGSGSAIMDISRMIFDHHFRTESAVVAVPYGSLIP